MEGRKRFAFGLLACGLLVAVAPAMAVVTVHNLNAYTAGAPLSQAGGAFTAGDDTTGVIDIVDIGGAYGKVAKIEGTTMLPGKAARTDSTGAGDVGRQDGMLYAGFEFYNPGVGAGVNIYDFQLQSGGGIVSKLIGNGTDGYMREPIIVPQPKYNVGVGWHSVVIANYSDGTLANSWVDLSVDGVVISHHTQANSYAGIWPALANNADARAQQLRLAYAPSDAGGWLYVDNIWGGNTMVPEPATLGLLALGALFVGRRRARA